MSLWGRSWHVDVAVIIISRASGDSRGIREREKNDSPDDEQRQQHAQKQLNDCTKKDAKQTCDRELSSCWLNIAPAGPAAYVSKLDDRLHLECIDQTGRNYLYGEITRARRKRELILLANLQVDQWKLWTTNHSIYFNRILSTSYPPYHFRS